MNGILKNDFRVEIVMVSTLDLADKIFKNKFK
jgi:hypothetical protein